jgi:hypothetical protein
MKSINAIAVALVALLAAKGAAGATVTFTLDLLKLGIGNLELRACVSPGDNGGLAAYNVALTNVKTVNHNSLRNGAASNVGGEEGTVGFTTFRSADDAIPAVSNLAIAGSQDTITPTPFIIYGLGQQPGNLTARGITTAGSKEGDPWAADMVIATGTYDITPGQPVAYPGWDSQAAVLTSANVFVTTGSTRVVKATVELLIAGGGLPCSCFPEPSTAALGLLAAPVLMAHRRRNMCGAN